VIETHPLRIRRLHETIGAEVLDVDIDRLLNDDDLPARVRRALEEHGLLLFRELHADDRVQLAFAGRLGEISQEMAEIRLRPENPLATALQGNRLWHIDGTTRGSIPEKATILTARRIAPEGGETQFASTYAAYEGMADHDKARCQGLRVIHSFAAARRSLYPSPTPEQLADWAKRGLWEYPLVWSHRSGRRSLILGSSAEYIIGIDRDESRALLDDLLERATGPDRVYTHRWRVGDMVIWDNPGTLHRVLPFDKQSGRELHRTTLVGESPGPPPAELAAGGTLAS
jgi:alpha-ketoglutarate-dependent taurine dioxygenase